MVQYQLFVQFNGKGELKPTTWGPRSRKAINALAGYYSRTWPQNNYWIGTVDA